MKNIQSGLLWLLRLACYGGLLFVVTGIASLVFVSTLGVCPELNEGNIRCDTQFYKEIADYAMVVLLLTVFTGIPGLLAIGGVVFAFFDVRALRRRSKGGTGKSANGEASNSNLSGSGPTSVESDQPPLTWWTGPLGFVVKAILVVMAITFGLGVITGIYQAITGS